MSIWISVGDNRKKKEILIMSDEKGLNGDNEFQKYLNESEREKYAKNIIELEILKAKSDYLLNLLEILGNLKDSTIKELQSREKKYGDVLKKAIEQCEQTSIQYDYMMMNMDDDSVNEDITDDDEDEI